MTPASSRSSLAARTASGSRKSVVSNIPVTGTGLRIAVVSNTAWNLVNFRLNLIRKLQLDGHSVLAVAPPDRYVQRLESAGITFEPVAISPAGVNPISELRSVFQLWRALRRHRIDLVLSYTPKGNLYSALASIAARTVFAPNVSGLGRAFIHRSPVTWVALVLYRLTFRRARRVFFQNLDDLRLFVRARLVLPGNAERLPGSGVDVGRFMPAPLPTDRSPSAPVFLLVARMLWDKGVGEFVAAARRVRLAYPDATFRLLGPLASQNAAAISAQQLEDWVREGIVTYLGPSEDVRPHMADADCVVLPSYREGVPRALLEAAAMGRPVITTDVPGCRDAVIDGETGLLCRARDVDDLAAKLCAFIAIASEGRARMARRARTFVEQQFSEDTVIDRYRSFARACDSRRGVLPLDNELASPLR